MRRQVRGLPTTSTEATEPKTARCSASLPKHPTASRTTSRMTPRASSIRSRLRCAPSRITTPSAAGRARSSSVPSTPRRLGPNVGPVPTRGAICGNGQPIRMTSSPSTGDTARSTTATGRLRIAASRARRSQSSRAQITSISSSGAALLGDSRRSYPAGDTCRRPCCERLTATRQVPGRVSRAPANSSPWPTVRTRR